MSDAYETLREMLEGVPDGAQVYVEELESIVEWPGITAGTFRALLAEIAGFEAMWEQREKANEAALAEVTKERDSARAERADLTSRNTALRAQLATAERELQPEWEFPDLPDDEAQLCVVSFATDHQTTAKVVHRGNRQFVTLGDIKRMLDREYPATPSGEGVNCADVAGCDGKCCATPSPEAREVPSDVMLRVERESLVRITPADAKRIVAMGQEVE